jgi:hypothetical protein
MANYIQHSDSLFCYNYQDRILMLEEKLGVKINTELYMIGIYCIPFFVGCIKIY